MLTNLMVDGSATEKLLFGGGMSSALLSEAFGLKTEKYIPILKILKKLHLTLTMIIVTGIKKRTKEPNGLMLKVTKANIKGNWFHWQVAKERKSNQNHSTIDQATKCEIVLGSFGHNGHARPSWNPTN